MSISVRTLLAQNNGQIRLCEAHDLCSREIIRHTVGDNGESFQGVWVGGLCQTTYLGIPDTELVSPLKRAIMAALNISLQQRKPYRPLCIAFDADSGGDVADIPALVAVLALVGVSMIIIEDRAVYEPGQKVSSLGDTSASQDQANMYDFADTIRAFKSAAAHKDMMITPRIESLTVRIARKDEAEEQASIQEALCDALRRAEVYREAGADAIMIHSKSTQPGEVLSFLTEYRSRDAVMPLVAVPTMYPKANRTLLHETGANVIIYATQLMRAKITAVGRISDKILAERPGLFSKYAELTACLEARNFACLLRKLRERKDQGEECKEVQLYRIAAETYAAESMEAVLKDLLNGKLCGSEADERTISVKDLLKINACQTSAVEDLIS